MKKSSEVRGLIDGVRAGRRIFHYFEREVPLPQICPSHLECVTNDACYSYGDGSWRMSNVLEILEYSGEGGPIPIRREVAREKV